MTEEPLPPEEAAVRRLLGEAGEAPSMPPDVAHRLDATLADLVRERADTDPERIAPVVALSSRRRKALAALFVAAAAVVVAGIGVPLVHHSGDTERTASSDSSLNRPAADAAGGSVAVRPSRRHAELHMQTRLDRRHLPHSYVADATSQSLSVHHLRSRLLGLRAHVPATAAYSSTTVHAPSGFTCAPAHFGPGYLLGIRYAGAPAVVAFRAPTGSTQVADVLQCGTARVLRSMTLPAR